MNAPAVYLHPENSGIAFNPDLLALTCWNDGNSLMVPIGPLKLVELGRALVAVGQEMGAPKDTAPKGETPTSRQASGVPSEQNELFDLPAFCPILPPRGSAAEQALTDLMARDLTQLDWLNEGKGWRLAAAVKDLDYLGWMPDSIRVKCAGWGRKIARYSLPAKAKQAAHTMRGGASA